MIGGNLAMEFEHTDLNKMMENSSLFEKDNLRDYYTWSNKYTDGIIYSRIYRMLRNISWLQDNLDITLKILLPSVQDHALLCFTGMERVEVRKS